MLRVLMVLEDYGELMFLQTVLKKIGFDVDAIQNPRQFQDSLLNMNPDVLVMTGTGKKINGLDLSRSVKRVRGLPHIILIRSGGSGGGVIEPDEGVGLWLDSPVGAMPLLNAIADLCGLNKAVMAEKFARMRLQEMTSDVGRKLNIDGGDAAEMEKAEIISGNFGELTPPTLSAADRRERYKKFLTGEVPAEVGFSVKQVQEQVKDLRRAESPDDLAELERQRRAFVDHLFRKKD